MREDALQLRQGQTNAPRLLSEGRPTRRFMAERQQCVVARFDLVPDVGERREHSLAFECERNPPTGSELLALAKRWDVIAAGNLIDAVAASMAQFAAVAKARGVPSANVAEIGADVARRAGRLAS